MQPNHNIKQAQENIPISSNGRIVGHVIGGIFSKSIHGSKHILHSPPSIAISTDALTQAEQAGAVEIRIVDQETGTLYRSTFEHFRETAFELDRGYGPQLALKLEGWTRERKNGGLVQLDIFSGGVKV